MIESQKLLVLRKINFWSFLKWLAIPKRRNSATDYFLSFSKYSVGYLDIKNQWMHYREIGPEAENAVHFIKINILDF